MPADNKNPALRRPALAAFSGLLLAGFERLGFFAANVPAFFGSYKRHANIAYGPEPQQRLDVYMPGRAALEPRPVVVFWHGGRWREGDKADYRFVGAALAESGYLTFVPNYRHYPQVKMPGYMHDAALAALFAAAHASDYGGARERLYLMGHSAGAHLAALVALDPSYFEGAGQRAPRIAGVIGLSGPYDFLPLLEPGDQDMFGPPHRYAASQPINYARADAPPMLLVQGLNDETVKPKNACNLATALDALGVPVTLKLYANCSHADTIAALTALLRGRAPTLADIRAFVSQGRGVMSAVGGAGALGA
jgi:acetyl esterase/lipase